MVEDVLSSQMTAKSVFPANLASQKEILRLSYLKVLPWCVTTVYMGYIYLSLHKRNESWHTVNAPTPDARSNF